MLIIHQKSVCERLNFYEVSSILCENSDTTNFSIYGLTEKLKLSWINAGHLIQGKTENVTGAGLIYTSTEHFSKLEEPK